MADVGSSVSERGQLILVGGLSLAVIFVALALVLNSAIYTENLATRTSDNPSNTALQFRQDAIAGTGTIIDQVNRNGSDRTYTERYDEYQATIEDWQRIHANYAAVNGLFTEVRTLPEEDGNEGTLVVDDNPDSNFTSRQNQANWLAADDVQVRQFLLSVNRDSLHSLNGSEFNVKINDGVSSWRVAVYRESDSVVVRSYDHSGDTIGTCTAEGSSVQIDITEETIDSTQCDALSFVEELSDTYDINYANAGSVTGTYRLTIDRRENDDGEDDTDDRYFDSPSGGTPYTTPAIYSATVELVYDGPSVTYETKVRVAPGEPGDRTVAPPVAQLATFDGDGDDGSFNSLLPIRRSNVDVYSLAGAVTRDEISSSVIHSDASGDERGVPREGAGRFTVYPHGAHVDDATGALPRVDDTDVTRWSA